MLQHALSSLEVLYDLGQNVSLYALKKAVHISRGMTSAWVSFDAAGASVFVGRLCGVTG